jgi:hypothetical protein
VAWVAEQQARIVARFGDGYYISDRTLPAGLSWRTRELRWSRPVSIGFHLAKLATHSAFIVLGRAGGAEFLAAEREHLLRHFPDGELDEPYVTFVAVGVRPAAAS